MIALGLNAQGTDIALELNPVGVSAFDPATEPGAVIADPAGVVRNHAVQAGVTMLDADAAGIVLNDAQQASVTVLDADGAGIVRNSAEQASGHARKP